MVEKKGKLKVHMGNEGAAKKSVHGKDIFLTGEYIEHFKPEEKGNPFLKIYKKKKQDTIDIINKTKEVKTILDVGGGMGRLSLALAESAQNKIVLADISIDMLKLVRENGGVSNNVQVVNSDAHYLPFQEKSFDIVVGLDIMCHLDKPERALSEFHRVLTERGMLILDSTNSNPIWALFYPRYMGMNPLNWVKILRYKGILPDWNNIVRHYPKKKFYSLLHNMGFKVLRNLNYGPVVCPKWHLTVSVKESGL